MDPIVFIFHIRYYDTIMEKHSVSNCSLAYSMRRALSPRKWTNALLCWAGLLSTMGLDLWSIMPAFVLHARYCSECNHHQGEWKRSTSSSLHVTNSVSTRMVPSKEIVIHYWEFDMLLFFQGFFSNSQWSCPPKTVIRIIQKPLIREEREENKILGTKHWGVDSMCDNMPCTIGIHS